MRESRAAGRAKPMLLDHQYKLESPSGFHAIGEPFSGAPWDAPLGERGPFGVQPRLSSSSLPATGSLELIRNRLFPRGAPVVLGLLGPSAYRRARVRQGRSLPSLRSVQLRAHGWPMASL